MKLKDVKKRFEEVNIGKNIVCSQQELELFITYGLLFPKGSKYVTRDGNKLSVTDVTDTNYKMSLNFKAIIDASASMCQNDNIKRVYCMSTETYNSYLAEGLIIQLGDEMVFRIYDKEYWKICKI